MGIFATNVSKAPVHVELDRVDHLAVDLNLDFVRVQVAARVRVRLLVRLDELLGLARRQLDPLELAELELLVPRQEDLVPVPGRLLVLDRVARRGEVGRERRIPLGRRPRRAAYNYHRTTCDPRPSAWSHAPRPDLRVGSDALPGP